MFRFLTAWLARRGAGQRHDDSRIAAIKAAREAVRAASAAWAKARVRGDTRGQHYSWLAYRDAKSALLRAELGL